MNRSILILTAARQPLLQEQPPPQEQLLNVLLVTALILLIGLTFVALIVLLGLLLPGAGERSKAALRQTPWRAFGVGLANYIFLGGIGLLLLSTERPGLSLLGLLIGAFLSGVTAVGLLGLAHLAGERLAALSRRELSPLWQVAGASAVMLLAGLFPLVGWFLLTPILLMTAYGAALLAWRSRRRPAAWEPEVTP